jgi:hypothetical protein
MQHLQQQLDIRNAEIAQLQNLFSAMRYGTDQQASGLLASMRLGASVEEMLEIAGDLASSSHGCVDRGLWFDHLLTIMQEVGGIFEVPSTAREL